MSNKKTIEEQKKTELIACYDRLCGMALALTKCRERANDIVQDTYEKAFRNLEKYELGSNACGWMNTNLKNKFKDSKRKKSTKITDFYGDFSDTKIGVSPTVEDEHIDIERQQQIQLLMLSAIDKLPPYLKEVIVLHYTTDLSEKDIAVRLRKSVNDVKCKIGRAIEYLRDGILKDEYGHHIEKMGLKLKQDEDERYNFGLFAV